MRSARVLVYALVFLALVGLFIVFVGSQRSKLVLVEKNSWENAEQGTFTIQGAITNKGKKAAVGVELVAECIGETGGIIFGEGPLEEYTVTKGIGRVGAKEQKNFSIDIQCPGTRIVVKARSQD